MMFQKLSFGSLVILWIICHFQISAVTSCCPDDKSSCYVDAALELLKKAKSSGICSNKPMDCSDILRMGQNTSGVYKVWPRSRLTGQNSIDVYCDMETDQGGWTVIQRRGNFLRAEDYFYKDWESYKIGFGGLYQDFWLGNDNIFSLTNQKLYSIQFDLASVDGEEAYALYDTFWIDDENNKYTLHVDGYSGTAGDSLIAVHNNQKFSTKDQKNDNTGTSCAQIYKGAWWYNQCHASNLNGLYLKGAHESYADGINWNTFKGHHESLESTEMKIRPKNFNISQKC